jgi:hypothetical protein
MHQWSCKQPSTLSQTCFPPLAAILTNPTSRSGCTAIRHQDGQIVCVWRGGGAVDTEKHSIYICALRGIKRKDTVVDPTHAKYETISLVLQADYMLPLMNAHKHFHKKFMMFSWCESTSIPQPPRQLLHCGRYKLFQQWIIRWYRSMPTPPISRYKCHQYKFVPTNMFIPTNSSTWPFGWINKKSKSKIKMSHIHTFITKMRPF